MTDKVIIIGAGIAGVQSAITLAKAGFKPLLISNEPYAPYYRMRLEEVVSGASPESIAIHPIPWYEENGIELVFDEVVSIDRAKQRVGLKSGREYPYDRVICAQGANAARFPLAGAEDRCYTLRRMSDALILNKILKDVKSVSIIGGGILGLELGASIKESFDVEVSIIEGQEYILSKQLDRDSSSILKSHLESNGLAFYEGVSAKEYRDGCLVLSDGTSVSADIIIFSIGVRSDIALLESAGIKADKSIVVDCHLKTSDEHIYAIGDVASLNGEGFSLAMFAREQGIFASNEIISGDSEYKPSHPSTTLKIAGLDLFFFGSMDGEKIVFEKDSGRITCFVSEGTLVGIILLGAKSYLMKVRGIVGKPFDRAFFE